MANPNIAKLKKKAADFEQKKQFDRALSLYIQLLEEAGRDLDDADLQLFNRVGDLLQRQGNVSEALAYYEKAVDVYAERGFLNNAIALCNKILRQSPARTTVYYKLGKISASKGFKSDAKKNFLEYADRMQKAGHVDEAFRALKEFADLCPDQDDIRLMLAEWLNKENRKSEAIEQLEVLYSKLEAEGRKAEARATIDRIKAIDPDVTPRVSGAWQAQKSNDLVFLDIGAFEAPPARRNADAAAPSAASGPAAPGASAASAPPAARVPALDGLILAFDPEGEEAAATHPAAIDGFQATASTGEESATVTVGAIDGLEAGGTPADAASPPEVESILAPEPESWSATPEPIPLVTGLESPRVSLSGAHPALAPLIDEPPLSGREFAELALAADRERELPREHPRPEHDLAVPSDLPLLPSDGGEIDLLTVLRTPISSAAIEGTAGRADTVPLAGDPAGPTGEGEGAASAIDLLELPPLGNLVSAVTAGDAPPAVASPSPLVIDEGAIPTVDLIVAESAPITLETVAIPTIELATPVLSPFEPGMFDLPLVEPAAMFAPMREDASLPGDSVTVDATSVGEGAAVDTPVEAHAASAPEGVAADESIAAHAESAGDQAEEPGHEPEPAAASAGASRRERDTLELVAVDGSARTTDEIMVVPSEEIDEETKRSLRLEFSLHGDETPDAWVEAALGATDDLSLDRLLTPLGVPAIAEDAPAATAAPEPVAAPDAAVETEAMQPGWGDESFAANEPLSGPAHDDPSRSVDGSDALPDDVEASPSEELDVEVSASASAEAASHEADAGDSYVVDAQGDAQVAAQGAIETIEDASGADASGADDSGADESSADESRDSHVLASEQTASLESVERVYDSYAPVDEQPVRAGAVEPEIDLLDELTPPFMRHSAEEDASAALESARVHAAAEESTSIAGQVEVPASADVDREDVAADATAEYARGARGGEPEDERDREGAEHAAIASDGVDRLPEGSGAPDEDHPAVQDERGSDELLTGERASALDIEALRALVDVRQERDARAGEGELGGVDGALVEGAFQEPPVDLPLLDVNADADPLAIGQELDLGVSQYAVDDLLSQPPSFESVDSTEFVPDPELARELLSEGTRARGESTEDSRSDEARDPAGVSGNTEEWPADAAPEVLIDGEWRDEHMGDLVSGEVSAIVVPGTERPNRAGPRFDDLSAALMWPEPVGEDGGPPFRRRTPGSSEAFFARMHTPRSTLSFGGVEAQLRRRLELDPSNLGLRRQLGEALLDQGDREEGLLELDIAMRGYEQVGDLDGARSVADIVLRVIPTSVRHHQKRVEYAVRSNDRVRLVEAYVELADSLFRSGEPEKARVVYSRVLELSPGNGRARFALGLLSEEEHARDAGSERARDASVPVSPEYVVGLFDRSVPVSSAPGAAPTQTISSEIPVVVEGLFVSPPAAVEPPLELESAAAPLASGEARAAQREEVASVEEIVSREIEHHAAQGSRADVADVADHADAAEDSPAADATTEPNDLLDGHAAANDGVQVVGVEPVIEQGGTQDVEQGANASLDAAEGDDDVAPFPAPSLDDEIDAAFAEPPVVEPVTPPSSGVLPTGTDYDFVGTPPLGAAALATPFAADEGSNGDAGERGREERPADRPYIGTPRSATPLPAASLGLVPPRPSALPPVTTRPEPAVQPADGRDDDFIDLGSWLREEAPVRTTRMVTQEAAPTGDEQADFDEMLRRFKQGVAENVDEEDYDSHYDLGVAYKEMGLTDEAIAEFQKALRGDSNRVRSYEALGQCFVEKGQLQVAVTLLRRAVETTGADDQQLVGVLYLLGYASEVLARHADALGYYQRVFAVDIEFRDVAQRVAAMEHVTQ